MDKFLIGEENLPQNLRRWERVHNRMLDWVQAQPCDVADAKHLARLYCTGIDVDEDLLGKIIATVDGCTRRVCVNLDHIRAFARGKALTSIDAAQYTGRIDSGNPRR